PPLDGGLTVLDNSSTTLTSATVSIGSGFLSGDTLGFVDQNGIKGSYDAATGVLSLSGTASVANYRTALDSITFGTNNPNPTVDGADIGRTIQWSVSDGLANSTVAHSTLDVHAVPTIVAGADVNYRAGPGTSVVLDSSIGAYDGTHFSGATVSIAGGFVAGDTLSANTAGTSIQVNYDATHGILTLTGSDTPEHYQAVLGTVTLASKQIQSGPVTIAWRMIDDNHLTSALATSTVHVTGDVAPSPRFTSSSPSTPTQNVTPVSLVVDDGRSFQPSSSAGGETDPGGAGSGYQIVHTDAVLTTASDATVQIRLSLAALGDSLGGDVVLVTARLANGDPLPDWLKFDPTTGTFAGLPPDGAVASIEPDQSADNNVVTGSISPNSDLGIAGLNAPARPNTITIKVTARDSRGNIAVSVFTIDLRAHMAGRQGWNIDRTVRPFGYEHHASQPMLSPELAAIEAPVRDVTRLLGPFAMHGVPIGHSERIVADAAEVTPAGRAGLTEQLASIGWRSMAAQRNALLASLQQGR
ncbi:MAG TPA: putative Ig domain-containing protein, partial [Steroidobacteraceae bacterium]